MSLPFFAARDPHPVRRSSFSAMRSLRSVFLRRAFLRGVFLRRAFLRGVLCAT
jgi:hypothetical protein